MWRVNWKFFFILFSISAVSGIGLFFLLRLSPSGRHLLQYSIYLSLALSLSIIVYAGYIIIKSMGKINVASHQAYKAALSFSVPPEKAVLYVIRPQLIGFARGLPFYIDGKELWLKGKMFYHLALPEGTYTLSGNKSCLNELTLDLRVGEIHFVEQQLMASLFKTGYQHVEIEDPREGKDAVMRCKKMLTWRKAVNL